VYVGGYRMYGGEEKCRQGFGRKVYTKKTTWKNEMQMGE
jgi:hypothetical protein